MRDQRLGIELALGNKLQRFLAVAAVNAAGLEGQIFAAHIRQRQSLRPVVKRYYRDNRIRARALPRSIFPPAFLYATRSAEPTII